MASKATDATTERERYIKQTETARKRAQEPDQRQTPATKAEEWEALRKIRAIVEALGTDSYIGTAFMGAWAIAELNIENDWADSVRGEQELLEERVNILARQVSEAKQEANELREELRGAEERGREQMDLAEENAAARERAEEALAEAENRAEALKRSRYEYNQKLTAAKATIAELEAKLLEAERDGTKDAWQEANAERLNLKAANKRLLEALWQTQRDITQYKERQAEEAAFAEMRISDMSGNAAARLRNITEQMERDGLRTIN